MIGISFHSGGHVDKPFPWVVEHLGSIGYDAIEIVCGPEAHIRTGEPLEPQLAQAKQLLAVNKQGRGDQPLHTSASGQPGQGKSPGSDQFLEPAHGHCRGTRREKRQLSPRLAGRWRCGGVEAAD